MDASRIILAAVFALVFTGSLLAQKQLSNMDGKIVTSASAAQSQVEEPVLKAATPSVDAAWSMLTTATKKATQAHAIALAALGTMALIHELRALCCRGVHQLLA